MLRRKKKSSMDLRPEVMMIMETKTRRVMKKQTMATMAKRRKVMKRSGLLRIKFNQQYKVTGSSVRMRSSAKSTTMLNLTTS